VIPQIFQNLEMVNFEKAPSPSLFEQAKSLAGERSRSTLVGWISEEFPRFPLAVLPQASNGGYLPYWLAFVSVVSVFNTVQTFVSPTLTKRIYSKKPEEGEYCDQAVSDDRPLMFPCLSHRCWKEDLRRLDSLSCCHSILCGVRDQQPSVSLSVCIRSRCGCEADLACTVPQAL
jgi:hypothetical protein